MTMDNRYEEALKRARQEHNDTKDAERKQLLEELFPELRKSKDERIREEIKVILANTDLSQFALDYTFADMINWLEKKSKKQTYQSNERAWLYLVADILTWREGIGQYLDDSRVQELAKKIQKEYSQKLYIDKQGEQISKLDIDDMVEKYRQEQFPLHNSSTSSHNPYYPVGYVDNMIAQYRKGINDVLNFILRK